MSPSPARRWWRRLLALVAVGFWYASYLYVTLPDVRVLERGNPTSTAFMERRVAEAREGGRDLKPRQRWLPYARISPQLKRAVLVAEDSAFWEHEGIDFEQIKESFEVQPRTDGLRTGREHHHAATGQEPVPLAVAQPRAQGPRVDDRAASRGGALQAAHPGDLPERHRVGRRRVRGGRRRPGPLRSGAGSLGPEQSALLAAAIINPRLLDPSHPSARLLRRQRMLLRSAWGA